MAVEMKDREALRAALAAGTKRPWLTLRKGALPDGPVNLVAICEDDDGFAAGRVVVLASENRADGEVDAELIALAVNLAGPLDAALTAETARADAAEARVENIRQTVCVTAIGCGECLTCTTLRDSERRADAAERDLGNAAHVAMTANSEAVRYRKERDALRAEVERLLKAMEAIATYIDSNQHGNMHPDTRAGAVAGIVAATLAEQS